MNKDRNMKVTNRIEIICCEYIQWTIFIWFNSLYNLWTIYQDNTIAVQLGLGLATAKEKC